MSGYLVRRLAIAVPSILGISIVLFAVLALAPGDPFQELATNPNVPPEVAAALRTKFGLDDPIAREHLAWMAHEIHQQVKLARGKRNRPTCTTYHMR